MPGVPGQRVKSLSDSRITNDERKDHKRRTFPFLWKRQWDVASWVWPWNNWGSDIQATGCVLCSMRNTQKMWRLTESTLRKFCSSCHLLGPRFIPIDAANIARYCDNLSKPLIKGLRAESIFGMQRINLSKPSIYLESLNITTVNPQHLESGLLWQSMRNTARNIFHVTKTS